MINFSILSLAKRRFQYNPLYLEKFLIAFTNSTSMACQSTIFTKMDQQYLFEKVPHSIPYRGQSFESPNIFEETAYPSGDVLNTPIKSRVK